MLLRHLFTFGQSQRARIFARTGAVLFLITTILHGAVRGGHFEDVNSPWHKASGKFASLVGLAADDIKITGLTHHDPQMLLAELGISPGGSLVGFDAGQARYKLQNMDWVSAASVQRKFPNTLQIDVAEREPFAIWQQSGTYKLIDRDGVAMGGLELMSNSHLLLLTGDGANLQAQQLVNHLEAYPELKSKVSAAAYVGKRRWTLYLQNGVKIALPAENASVALKQVAELEASQHILSKGITDIDLRIAGQMTVALAEIEVPKKVVSADVGTKKPH
jgi:cell division protein FtsQ